MQELFIRGWRNFPEQSFYMFFKRRYKLLYMHLYVSKKASRFLSPELKKSSLNRSLQNRSLQKIGHFEIFISENDHFGVKHSENRSLRQMGQFGESKVAPLRSGQFLVTNFRIHSNFRM